MKKSIVLVISLLLLFVAGAYAQSTGGRGGSSSSTPTALPRVTVNANVPGADVLINGSVRGQAPITISLNPGTYTIRVVGRGYNDWQQNIRVNGDMTVNANLAPANFSLSVRTNVPGAQVFINNQNRGRGNVNQSLPPGNYQVRVTAPGYTDYNVTVNLNQNQTVNAVLQPAMGTLNIIIPTNVLDLRVGNPQAQIKVFVDGSPQNGSTFQLTPGRHAVRISSGGMSTERMFDIVAGQSYNIEVFMGFTVNGE